MINIATPAEWCRPAGAEPQPSDQNAPAGYANALAGLVRHFLQTADLQGADLQAANQQAEAIAQVLRRVVLAQEAGHACVPLASLPSHLSRALLAANPSAAVSVNPSQAAPSNALLVVDNGQVYVPRTRDFELRFARAVAVRLAADPASAEPHSGSAVFLQLSAALQLNAGQQRAVQSALQLRLCVITGGPGTGKTTCLSAILALLLAANPALRIALAAPTGKAAARMQEALARGFDALAAQPWFTPALRARVPPAVTVHRLLRLSPQHRTPYGQGAAQTPLPFDCVVVDESSMLDLALAARLGDALQASARLVLLGDSAQLAAVEHGVAFHALCESAHLQAAAQSCIVRLTQSWRFDAASAIGQLARSIETGDAAALAQVLEQLYLAPTIDNNKYAVVSAAYAFTAINNELANVDAERDSAVNAWQQSRTLTVQLYAHFAPFRAALAASAPPAALLAAFAQFQVLAAVNGGPFGTQVLNAALAAMHRTDGNVQANEPWFHGRPVLVLHNQPLLGLANGDVGIVLQAASGALAVFAKADAPGGVLHVAVAQLQGTSDAYVLTVHKAQGSEYQHVAFVLPPASSSQPNGAAPASHPSSRELLYTAVTRAKSRISLYADCADVMLAAATSVKRQHGLEARLVQAPDLTAQSTT